MILDFAVDVCKLNSTWQMVCHENCYRVSKVAWINNRLMWPYTGTGPVCILYVWYIYTQSTACHTGITFCVKNTLHFPKILMPIWISPRILFEKKTWQPNLLPNIYRNAALSAFVELLITNSWLCCSEMNNPSPLVRCSCGNFKANSNNLM